MTSIVIVQHQAAELLEISEDEDDDEDDIEDQQTNSNSNSNETDDDDDDDIEVPSLLSSYKLCMQTS